MITFISQSAESYLFGFHPVAVALFSAITSIIIMLLSIGSYHFFTFPYVKWTEQKETIKTLQSTFEEKQTKESKMAVLTNLLEAGNVLYTKKITEAEFTSWAASVKTWQDRVILVTQAFFSKLEVLSVANVDYNAVAKYNYKVNNEHNTQLLILRERLKKFENLIRKYQDENS